MDIASVTERGAQGRPDEVLLDEALSEARIMLTCDTDFLRLAAERHTSGIEFAPIVFWPQQQRSIGNVVRSVIQVATNYAYEDACSRVFFL
jgi:hypothetical protein